MVHHAPSMQHRTTASKMLALLLNLACTSFKLLIISSPGKPLGILGFSGAADDEQLLHLDLSAPDGSAVLQDAHDLSEAHRPNPKKGDVPQKTAVREERLRRETRTTFHAGLPEGSTVHQKEHPKWLTAGASEQVSAHVPDDSSRTGGSLLLQIQDALFDRESLEDTVADTKDWKIMKLIMGQQGRRHRAPQPSEVRYTYQRYCCLDEVKVCYCCCTCYRCLQITLQILIVQLLILPILKVVMAGDGDGGRNS